MLVTVDMPQENLAGFRAMLAANEIEVRGFDEIGPAGGNPRFRLLVDSSRAMRALTDFYWGAE